MPVASGLLESTALRHPGTSPIHVKVMGGLRNASLSFVGPPADRRRLGGVYGMGSSTQKGERMCPLKEGPPERQSSTGGRHARMKVVQRERKSQAEKICAKVLRQEQA